MMDDIIILFYEDKHYPWIIKSCLSSFMTINKYANNIILFHFFIVFAGSMATLGS